MLAWMGGSKNKLKQKQGAKRQNGKAPGLRGTKKAGVVAKSPSEQSTDPSDIDLIQDSQAVQYNFNAWPLRCSSLS